jgi:4-amino-4-deoxy-L-arabinose transferase-like glycosyltransferase
MATRASSALPTPSDRPAPAAKGLQRTASAANPETRFLYYVYFGTLFVRLLLGVTLLLGGYNAFFAADSGTYDELGWDLARYWAGELQFSKWLARHLEANGFNGMFYWVAIIYSVIGHSRIGATIIQCAIVSTTPVLVYKICLRVYGSVKAARYSALLTAFLPSMIIWSCSLLKDPLITFLVCVSVFYTLKMQQELKLRFMLPGLIAMLLIYQIRGYVFYFVLLSIIGTLFMSRFGRRADLTGYLIRLGGIAIIAVAIFALGFDKIASQQINAGVLDRIQSSRTDLAQTARSGFGADANVSTLGGALRFLPVGITYLLFAPFPWQSGGIRMLMALPETLLWYALFPYCLKGIIYTVRKHLRDAMVIFLFVIQLTGFYSIFIGNVGTAHRQRTQIFIFYLIFTAVGLVQAKRKNVKLDGTIRD